MRAESSGVVASLGMQLMHCLVFKMARGKLKSLLCLASLLVLLFYSTMHSRSNTNPVRRTRPPSSGTSQIPASLHVCKHPRPIAVVSAQMPEPFMEAEQMRRQVGRDVRHTWQVTSHDLTRLNEVDGFREWREKEAAALSALVQHRLHILQNPPDCASAKKIYCDFKAAGRGIGSQLHHLSYCFLASYGTQRTLILDTKNYNGNPEGLETFFLPLSDTCTSYDKSQMVPWPGERKERFARGAFPGMDRPNPRPNYFPKSIPKDISERLVRLHGDPFAWWMGQFFKYAMRMNKDFQDYIDNQAREMGYESPIVGLQIRRSDKLIHEAVYIDLSVYMEEVEGFYKQLELRQPVAQRRVFLATDDPNVIPEIKQ
ncbi:hypothetical protein C7M84_009937, partial [Penaeus vannamei]